MDLYQVRCEVGVTSGRGNPEHQADGARHPQVRVEGRGGVDQDVFALLDLTLGDGVLE
jgi:hypothetical protein